MAIVNSRDGLRTIARCLPQPLRRVVGRLATRLVTGVSNSAYRISYPYLTVKRVVRNRSLQQAERSREPIALFLAPEAGLEPYFASHAIIARTVREQGLVPLLL